MNKTALFSILVITYNRPALLRECLCSIAESTCQDFEVYVLDRGSEPPVQALVEEFGERFHYVRSSQDVHLVDGANAVMAQMKGQYFFHLADDDVICSNCLQRVKEAFARHPECNVVQIGLCGYDWFTDPKLFDISFFSRLNEQPFDKNTINLETVHNGRDLCLAEWETGANVLIGRKTKQKKAHTFLHPSCLFFRFLPLRELAEKYNQGKIYLKPMWDLGAHGLIWYSQVVYLYAPLAIISENSPGRQCNSSYLRWRKEHFGHIPLKIGTLTSTFTETVLKLIKRYQLAPQKDVYVHPDLYFAMHDSIHACHPRTVQTKADLAAVRRMLWKELFLRPDVILSNLWRRQQARRKVRRGQQKDPRQDAAVHFPTITQWRKFVEKKFFTH